MQPFISDKIEKLELEIEERKKHLGYAKTIKLFGRFPAFPREMGQVTCQEFRERSIEQWNMEIDEHDKKYLRLAEILLSDEFDQIGELELGMMFESIIDMFTPGSEMNKTIELNVLLQGLTDSKDKEPSDTMDFCKAHGDQAIIHTMDKIPVYIKYIEKEYQISVYNKTKQKNLLRDKKRLAKAYDSDWNQYVFADVI